MSRITKQIAENVAIKLTEKQALEIKELKANLSLKFTDVYLKTIPKEVLDTFELFPSYFKVRGSVQLNGNGFNWQTIYFDKNLPYVSSNFQPSEKYAKFLIKLAQTIEEKENEFSTIKREIFVLLISLRTYIRVNSEFPEATPFLPNSVSSALMVNISDLRKKLK